MCVYTSKFKLQKPHFRFHMTFFFFSPNLSRCNLGYETSLFRLNVVRERTIIFIHLQSDQGGGGSGVYSGDTGYEVGINYTRHTCVLSSRFTSQDVFGRWEGNQRTPKKLPFMWSSRQTTLPAALVICSGGYFTRDALIPRFIGFWYPIFVRWLLVIIFQQMAPIDQ